MPPGDIPETREEWAHFVSALVHELRTPVGSLLMVCDLLQDEPPPAGAESSAAGRYARTLRQAAEDIQALLGETGELARALDGRIVPRVEPLPTDALVRRLEEVARPLAWERGVALQLEIAPRAPTVIEADECLLVRTLALLVEGAATGARSRVRLRIGRRDRRPLFAVSADGAVPESDAERAFEPFGDDPRARRRHGGRGLGLPLARELGRLLGGELRAAENDGRPGFELLLPAAP